jgi:hypothetical protein
MLNFNPGYRKTNMAGPNLFFVQEFDFIYFLMASSVIVYLEAIMAMLVSLPG